MHLKLHIAGDSFKYDKPDGSTGVARSVDELLRQLKLIN